MTTRRLPALSARLSGIVAMVPPSATVYDIGSDHALVPIYLVRNGVCRSACAGDIREGPLRMASRRIRQAGLEDNVIPVRSDGLEMFRPGKDDTVVLAGMGGNEMIRIMAERPPGSEQAAWVLQPMKSADRVRRWLDRDGFVIDSETLHRDGRHIYCVMRASWSGRIPAEGLSGAACAAGPRLMEQRPPLWRPYLRQLLTRLRKRQRGAVEAAALADELECCLKGQAAEAEEEQTT